MDVSLTLHANNQLAAQQEKSEAYSRRLVTTRNMALPKLEDTITLSKPSAQKDIYTASTPALEEFVCC